MGKLYDILKVSKLGVSVSPDYYTSLIAQSLSKTTVKELTDVPPLSFVSNGQPLIDWVILCDNNGVGEKTTNLANMYGINTKALSLTFTTGNNMTVKINGKKTDGVNIRDLVHPGIILPAGTYTVKIKMVGGSITNITGGVMFGINKSDYSMRTAPQVNTVGQVGTRTFTLNSDTPLTSLDITPSYSDVGAVFNDAEFQCWLYSGSGDVSYEPYGYKIPVICGNQTTNIYTDVPLSAGESISKSVSGIDIPTVNGNNTLIVDTTVQPSQVYIKYYK